MMHYGYDRQLEILNKLKDFVQDREDIVSMSSYALSWIYEILNHIPLPAAIVASNRKVRFANKELINWLGYSLEELKKKEFNQITVGKYIDPDVKLFEELLSGERKNYTIYKKWIKSNGEEVAGLLSVSVYVNGAPWMIAIIMPDYQFNEAITRSDQLPDITL